MKKTFMELDIHLLENITFPDRCIYCGKESPDSTAPLSLPDEENGANGRMLVFAVPSCQSCAYAQKERERQLANLSFTLFLVIFTGVASYLLHAYEILLYIAIGLFLATFLFSIQILKSGRSSISLCSVNETTLKFRFTSEKYKSEFIGMNSTILSENTVGVD